MTKADNIKRKIEQLNYRSTPAMRSRILSEASQAMEQTINAQPDKPSIRRMIMQSKITKLTTAAAIILVAITIIDFCKRHKIDKHFGKQLLYDIRSDLEWYDDWSIIEDYFR